MTPADDLSPKEESRSLAFQFDSAPFKLAGWAAHGGDGSASDEISLRLMVGDVFLGRLRRVRQRPDVEADLGRKLPACGFDVPDYGLRAFAELCSLTDLAVIAESQSVGVTRYPFKAMSRDEVTAAALGARTGVKDSLRLSDVWLGSARDLSLRFEGTESVARSIDAFQCAVTGETRLIKIAADHPIGGFVSVLTVKLLNPFFPVLLVFKGQDGAIDAVDLLPFPSLVRGGLHSGERLILGSGGDDLSETAAISTDLLQGLLGKTVDSTDHIESIVLDRAIHKGFEPMLDPDLLAWVTSFLGVRVEVPDGQAGGVPEFISGAISQVASPLPRPGHSLQLPADSIPTISALVNPVPSGGEAQQLVGAMGVVDRERQGRVWSVWQPPLGAWLEDFQPGSRQRTAPLLTLFSNESAESAADIAISWPLSLALREAPTRVASASPFEMSEDLPAPLLRRREPSEAVQLSVVVVCERSNQPISPLLESLVRQESVAELDVLVVAPSGKLDSDASDFLQSRLADRHMVVPQPFGRGKLEQLQAIHDRIKADRVLIVDGDTILSDPRTLATLLPMLDGPNVETVGCMLRSGEGKTAAEGAGYSPAGMNLRAIPAFSFAPIDPAVFRQPATYPVAANSLAVLLTTRAALGALDARGSVALRPEVDDLLFGLQIIDRGGLNLCSSIVSAYRNNGGSRSVTASIPVPYRLSLQTVSRLMTSATLVQYLR